MYKCNKCDKSFNLKSSCSNHIKSHLKPKKVDKPKLIKYKKCSKCKLEIYYVCYNKHFNSCDGYGPRSRRLKPGRGLGWSKGIKLTKKHKHKIQLSTINNYNGKASTPEKEVERCKKLSIAAKKHKLGGYIKGSGRGKKGWYKGYWCDSSWELAYVIYNLEHNILFKRNTTKFEYTFNNKIYKYIPDFILENDIYVEIKGYMDSQSKEKIKQFQLNIIVLMENELKYVFEYVISKYGKKYIELYDKK